MTTTGESPSLTRPERAEDRRLLRLGGGGLLISFGLMLALWSGEGPDHATVAADDARTFLVDTVAARDVAMHGSAFLVIAFGLTLGALWTIARRRAGEGALTGAVLVGGVLMLVDWWVFGAVTGVPAVVEGLDQATPEVARGWYALDKLQESFGDIGKAAQVLFLLGTGWTGLRGGFLHRPVAWSAFALVGSYVLSVVTYALGLDAVSTVFFLTGIFGLLLWFAAAGASLLLKARREA